MREWDWSEKKPDDIARWLEPFGHPWWICGGWAIDLFLGNQTRRHTDIEIGCFREDLAALFTTLPHLEFYAATDGTLRPLSGACDFDLAENGIWSRQRGQEIWDLEILVEDKRGDDWLYRRDNRITRPADCIVARTANKIPYMRPEIQLLYKARALRDKDCKDFENTMSHLDKAAQSWLAKALDVSAPDHIWISKLR